MQSSCVPKEGEKEFSWTASGLCYIPHLLVSWLSTFAIHFLKSLFESLL